MGRGEIVRAGIVMCFSVLFRGSRRRGCLASRKGNYAFDELNCTVITLQRFGSDIEGGYGSF